MKEKDKVSTAYKASEKYLVNNSCSENGQAEKSGSYGCSHINRVEHRPISRIGALYNSKVMHRYIAKYTTFDHQVSLDMAAKFPLVDT